MANQDESMEGMPVGNDDFRKLRDRDLYYVDKTPLIDMVLKSTSDVMLFTRPRRFGKSLNMSMLDAYLNTRYAGERDRFSGLKISELRPDDPEKNSCSLDFRAAEMTSATWALSQRIPPPTASLTSSNDLFSPKDSLIRSTSCFSSHGLMSAIMFIIPFSEAMMS